MCPHLGHKETLLIFALWPGTFLSDDWEKQKKESLPLYVYLCQINNNNVLTWQGKIWWLIALAHSGSVNPYSDIFVSC